MSDDKVTEINKDKQQQQQKMPTKETFFKKIQDAKVSGLGQKLEVAVKELVAAQDAVDAATAKVYEIEEDIKAEKAKKFKI